MSALTTQTIREVAARFARGDRRAAFNRCKQTALALASALCKSGFDARVVGGNFRPTTDPISWHPSWTAFSDRRDLIRHYWVIVGDAIVDATAAQFGEPSLVITHVDDARYLHDGEPPILPAANRPRGV
jgi:hypothetical protein